MMGDKRGAMRQRGAGDQVIQRPDRLARFFEHGAHAPSRCGSRPIERQHRDHAQQFIELSPPLGRLGRFGNTHFQLVCADRGDGDLGRRCRQQTFRCRSFPLRDAAAVLRSSRALFRRTRGSPTITGRRFVILAGGLRPPARTYASRGLRALASLSLARSDRARISKPIPGRIPFPRLPDGFQIRKIAPGPRQAPHRLRPDGTRLFRNETRHKAAYRYARNLGCSLEAPLVLVIQVNRYLSHDSPRILINYTCNYPRRARHSRGGDTMLRYGTICRGAGAPGHAMLSDGQLRRTSPFCAEAESRLSENGWASSASLTSPPERGDPYGAIR